MPLFYSGATEIPRKILSGRCTLIAPPPPPSSINVEYSTDNPNEIQHCKRGGEGGM